MSESIIRTAGLTRRFGSVLAVDGLDLEVPPATVYGFLGPNGAGKTTTIRMLLGLIRPDAGQVRLFGQSLAHERLRVLRRVGALVEEPSLYPHLTGYENLEVTRRLTGGWPEQIDKALATVHLEDAANRPVKGYSQGMRQRLGLALALLNEPELIILDEPTNGLDPAGIHEMRDLIRRLPGEQGITVFLSSHLLSEVEQMATHIGIINHGRLLFSGTLGELQEHRGEELVLGVNDPLSALEFLRQSGWTALHNGNHTLRVTVAGPDDVSSINRFLVRQGIDVVRLSLERPSLEQTFLELTHETEPALA